MVESNSDSENSRKLQTPDTSSGSLVEDKFAKRINRFAIAAIILIPVISLLITVFFDTGKRGIVIFGYISGVLLALPLVLGIISLVIICKRLKSCRHAIAIIALSAFFLSTLFGTARTTKMDIDGVVCQVNLKELGKAIIEYSESNDGYLPTADKWCDLLIEYRKNLTKDFFKCPSSKDAVYSYAFNKYLDGLRLKDVPDNVVLLYEANRGWNYTGGVERLTTKNHYPRSCMVLFADGTVRHYHVEELVNKPLGWKP